MAELVKGSTELSDQAAATYAANLLRHYSFELDHHTVDQLLSYWLESYSVNWVRLAIVEALYQGRYKAVSVGQILALWMRRGEPIYHFNHEFERLVCDKFPRNLALSEEDEQSSLLDPGLRYRRVPFQPEPRDTSPPAASVEEPLPGPVSDREEEGPPDPPDPPATVPVFLPHQVSLPHFVSGDRPPPASLAIQPALTQPDSPAVSEEIAPVSTTPANEPSVIAIVPESLPLEADATPRGGIAPLPAETSVTATESETKPACLTETDLLLPCLRMSDQCLKPKLKLQLTVLYQPNWSVCSAKPSIHQFIPISETSDFYSKLKSVANPAEETAE